MISGLLGRTSFLTRLLPKSAFVKKQFPAVTQPTGPTRSIGSRAPAWYSGGVW